MKRSMLVVSMMCISMTAFAGKAEREMMTKQVAPAVAAAEAMYKSACGCELTIKVDEETLKTKDELRNAKYMAERVTAGAKKYCTDEPSKKAVCQMKTLTLAKAKPASFTFKDGAGVATTDGQASCSWEMMTRQLDK